MRMLPLLLVQAVPFATLAAPRLGFAPAQATRQLELKDHPNEARHLTIEVQGHH